jgi:protein N-terminal glutamine amidohydrolase
MPETNQSCYKYTALFCEENIWHLADSLIKQGVKDSELNIVFISNPKQQVAIFNQKSGHGNHPVIWDYHVVLLRKTTNNYCIYDFDTKLAFETNAEQYLNLSFPKEKNVALPYQAQFRFIETQVFLNEFSSDRSHMLGIIDIDKFPTDKPIHAKENQSATYLHQFINFSAPICNDKVLTRNTFENLIRNK